MNKVILTLSIFFATASVANADQKNSIPAFGESSSTIVQERTSEEKKGVTEQEKSTKKDKHEIKNSKKDKKSKKKQEAKVKDSSQDKNISGSGDEENNRRDMKNKIEHNDN